MANFIPGIHRIGATAYSDTRQAGRERDPDRARQPELDWIMDQYPFWRSYFDGSVLEETISTSSDPQKAETQYKWPVKYNLVHSYCLLHAGMLWGKGRTGKESLDLFTIKVDPKVPGAGKERREIAPDLQDKLGFFWSQQGHLLRAHGMTQQWSGGTIMKVSWLPRSLGSIYGVQIETIQPERFYPVWNPLNVGELIAVKIKFGVSKAVAMVHYGLTEDELKDFAPNDVVPVEEYWDSRQYYIVVGKMRGMDQGVIARNPDTNEEYKGKNWMVHPVTKKGVIPFVYVPRLRTGGFFGDSLTYYLTGVQDELNKSLADFGDAVSRGSHPAFGITDYHGPAIIPINWGGAFNMGPTKPGGIAPKVHEFPVPQVPAQTSEFTDRLLSISETAAGLTPAARGQTGGERSGVALALQMLPTTNIIDWARAHWENAIVGPGGLNTILMTVWYNKSGVQIVPKIQEAAFGLRQTIDFKPVIPRDRLEVVDEVVRLVTAQAISPKEWIDRLGDIEDVDEELQNLLAYLAWKTKADAAAAGHVVKVTGDIKNPSMPLPEVAGVMPKPAQPAKQPQGQTSAAKKPE